MKDTVKRAKSFEGAIEKAGGKSLGFYYTIGKYDMVAMVEAPKVFVSSNNNKHKADFYKVYCA